MPFSEQCGFVAFLTQNVGEGQLIFGYQARATHAGENAWVVEAEGHLACHYAIASRGANGGGTVGIGEAHALGGHSIQVWRGHLGLGIVASDIAVA